MMLFITIIIDILGQKPADDSVGLCVCLCFIIPFFVGSVVVNTSILSCDTIKGL